MSESKMRLQRLGGNFQLDIRSHVDLKHITRLHPARWAATSALLENLNCDRRFLELLDTDRNGRIRSDEVSGTITWLEQVLKSMESLKSGDGTIALNEINPETTLGKEISEVAATTFPNQSVIAVDAVRATRLRLASGVLKGDGVITALAFKHTAAEPLAQLVLKSAGATKPAGVSALMLEQFVVKASACLQQADNLHVGGERRSLDEYVKYRALRDKIDEYFNFCRLVQLEPARLAQFGSSVATATSLALSDATAVGNYLAAAPLAFPNSAMTLNLTYGINPCYQATAQEFATTFMPELNVASWEQIKLSFVDYETYLNAAEELTLSDFCWRELNDCLKGPALVALRDLLHRDAAVARQIARLDDLEKLILCKQYFVKFTRNFVSFSELFSPLHQSMIQAGTVILDGRCFDLAIKIRDIQEHKKLAAKSNIYTIYLELKRRDLTVADPAQVNCSMLVAAAVTEGVCSRIYIGKPGIFIGWDGHCWDGKIVEISPGPVSLWQSLLLPVTNFNNFLFEKMGKLTSFSNLQQTLDKSLTALPGTAKPASGLANGGSLLVLCGGVGLAALGSSVALIIKSLSQISGLKLTCWIMAILLLISLPPVIAGIYKLRRRNLGLFLEAAGWAVNLPLRLGTRAGRLFTGTPRFPEHAQLIELEQLKSYFNSDRFQPRTGKSGALLLIAIIFVIWVIAILTLKYFGC